MRYLFLGLFHRRAVIPKTTAIVLLLTFTCLALLPPTRLGAQEQSGRQTAALISAPDAVAELTATLTQLEAKLAHLREKLAKGEDTGRDQRDLTQLRRRLHNLNRQAHQTFDRMEQSLQAKGLPSEIRRRHQTLVATYTSELATLLHHLDALEAARDDRARDDQATQTLQHLHQT